MNNLFKVHVLNENGISKANDIANLFNEFLKELTSIIFENEEVQTREFSLVKTKLEEACFYSKKTLANQIKYQKNQQ